MFLLAILVPPLAVLFCGKPVQALLNLALWACFILPGIIHACLVVNAHNARKNAEMVARAVR